MGLIGYIVSIPVFADSGFIILHPLNKSLSKQAGISLAGTSVALILGLLLTHVMVPPTPGPIAAAGILDADVGYVMMIGLAVSFVALWVAIIYASRIASRHYIDPSPGIDEAEIRQKISAAPSAFISFLPILVPILLIIGASLIQYRYGDLPKTTLWMRSGLFLGTPIVALIIGMLLSFLLPRRWDASIYSTTGIVGKALRDASTILLITGAGGIFGAVLQNSGIADILSDHLSSWQIGIWLPFLLAAAIKTAQGSSTVALITTASILAPMMVSLGFDSEIDKALAVVSIGAGSLVVSHANDSAFWVVTQLTGMEVKTGYRLYSLGTLIIGIFCALLLQVISLVI